MFSGKLPHPLNHLLQLVTLILQSLGELSIFLHLSSPVFFKKIMFVCLCIWLPWVLVAALGIFSCGMWNLVPWPRIEPWPPALTAWSLSRWTTREVPLRNIWGARLGDFQGWEMIRVLIEKILLIGHFHVPCTVHYSPVRSVLSLSLLYKWGSERLWPPGGGIVVQSFSRVQFSETPWTAAC